MITNEMLKNISRVHFIGIGGSGMYPLVQILHTKGYVISGSDNNETETLNAVRKMGITVFMGQRAENIEGAELIVYSAAIMADNPELVAAKTGDIPCFERAAVFGAITRMYGNCIAVCGTHGKTTSTSMMTHILMEANWDPTVMIGGYLPSLHAGHRVGHGDTIVMESCEYCNSFLNFCTTDYFSFCKIRIIM